MVYNPLMLGWKKHNLESRLLGEISITSDMQMASGSVGKVSAYNAGDLGSISGSGRSPGGGNGNSFPYSCLEKPTDRGAWGATVHGVTENRT